MGISRGIRDNFRFLIAEVDSQIANLYSYLDTNSSADTQRILDRSGYARNLKLRIHDSCVQRLSCPKGGDSDNLQLRSVEFIATDLERITDLCRECVRQMDDTDYRCCMEVDLHKSMLDRVSVGLQLIEAAVVENDTRLALRLSNVEQKLDKAFKKLSKGYITRLKQGKRNTEELIVALFVAHNIYQMGDALRNISEFIISANLGQPFNSNRYYSLQESMASLDQDVGELQLEQIAHTRSGSAISGIASSDESEEGYVAIYKDGEKRKLKEEREGVESWHEIYPGLAPQILSYHKRGKSAALLIEHLAGLTFEQILLHESQELLDEALEKLGETLHSVWRETRTKKSVNAHFMEQTQKRMEEVYSIHPEFRQGGNSVICGVSIPGFDKLVERARDFEESLEAPFSVYIHGDFNVDNIIYDSLEKRVNFIDLHRSRYMDYVQDVSVFMVSNYRLQILDAPLRRRIMALAQEFYRIAQKYAKKRNDTTFEIRLALGLARSFATSTRFILDKALARRMFLRSRFLIEQVLALDTKQAEKYSIPIKEIFVG